MPCGDFFHLKTKEEVQLTNPAHFKLGFHNMSKTITYVFICRSKNDIIYIYLSQSQITSSLLNQQGVINNPYFVIIFNNVGRQCVIP